MFPCAICNTPFKSRLTLLRHNTTVARCSTKTREVFACTVSGCTAKYHRNDFLVRHERKNHGMHPTTSKRKTAYNRMRLQSPNSESGQNITNTPEPIIIKAIVLNEDPPERDISKFVESLKPSLCKILTDALQLHQQIIFAIVLQTRLLQSTEANYIKLFSSKDITLRSPTDVEDTVDIVTELIATDSIEEVNKSEFNEILHLEVNIRKLKPQVGGHLPLHPAIVNTKSIVNVKNTDSYCFKWAIFAGLSTDLEFLQNLNLTYTYGIPDIRFEKIDFYGLNVNFSGLSFPTEVGNVRVFEENNPTISVNVFGVEDMSAKYKIIGPLYRTRSEKRKHINLLFLENQLKTICHYACIKSLALLLRQQLSEDYLRMEICNTCLKCFKSRTRLDRHKADPTKCKTLRTL